VLSTAIVHAVNSQTKRGFDLLESALKRASLPRICSSWYGDAVIRVFIVSIFHRKARKLHGRWERLWARCTATSNRVLSCQAAVISLARMQHGSRASAR
jgi:hypothetical protein